MNDINNNCQELNDIRYKTMFITGGGINNNNIMETGNELSKTVATFIVQKILLDELCLQYICQTPERFYRVSTVLGNMVAVLRENPSLRLLKHIIRCYSRLAQNLRAREALRQVLPNQLQDGTFNDLLKNQLSSM